MLLTSLMPFRHRGSGSRKHLQKRGQRSRCAAAVERLEVRTLLSAVNFSSNMPVPFDDGDATIALDVDISVSVAQVAVDLEIEHPEPDATYTVDLVAPDSTRRTLFSDQFEDDDGSLSVVLDDFAPSVSLGQWQLEVGVSIPTGGGTDGGDDDDEDDPDEPSRVESARLSITPVLDPRPTGTIRGVVFEDFDGDGVRDDSEPGRGFVDLNRNRDFDGATVLVMDRFTAVHDGGEQGTVYADSNRNSEQNDGEPVFTPQALAETFTVFIDLDGDRQIDDGEPRKIANDSGELAAPLALPDTGELLGVFVDLNQSGSIEADEPQIFTVDLNRLAGLTITFLDVDENGSVGIREPLIFSDMIGGLDERRFLVFADENGNSVVDSGEPNTVTDDIGTYEVSDRVSPATHSIGLIAGDARQLSSIGHDIVDSSGQPIRFSFVSAALAVEQFSVFIDLNADGLLNAGEPQQTEDFSGNTAESPVGVVDLNKNGKRDDSEPLTFFRNIEQRLGAFVMDGGAEETRTAATHIFNVDGMTGFVDVNGDRFQNDNELSTTLDATGQQLAILDDGKPGTVFENVNSASVVFIDLNGNGRRDDGELQKTFQADVVDRPTPVFADLNDNDELDDNEPLAFLGEQQFAVFLDNNNDRQVVIGDATEFSDLSGRISRDDFDANGFLTNGRLLPASAADSQWQLTDGQRFAANHSHDFSAVFANVRPDRTDAPDPGSRGLLLSPQVLLPSIADGPLELQFQSYVPVTGTGSVESLANVLQVSVVLQSGEFQRLTKPEFGFDSTGTFTAQTLDISEFAGERVQFEFEVAVPEAGSDSDGGQDNRVKLQAWYLDDIAVVQKDSPGSQIVHLNPGQRLNGVNFAVASGPRTVGGTVFSDLNGDGVRNPQEPGLPGQIVVFDRDNDDFDGQVRVFENTIAGDADGPLDLSVEIGDEVTGTLLAVELVGMIDFNNPDAFAGLSELSLGLSLESPFGQIQALSGVIAPPEFIFRDGKAPFPATFNMVLPETFVAALRTEPIDGTWELVGGDAFGRFLTEQLGATIDSLSLRLTVVQESNSSASDRFVITDAHGNWSFNGLQPDDPPRFDLCVSPLTALSGRPTADAQPGCSEAADMTFQSMPANDGLRGESIGDYNFGVFFADAHANQPPEPERDPDNRADAARNEPIELSIDENTGQIEQIDAAIDYLTDHDVFKLPAGTDGLVTIAVNTGLSSLNPVNTQLTVFTLADGEMERREVAFNDNSLFLLNGQFDARLQFQAVPDQNYFVEVSGSDLGDPFPLTPRQQTGRYQLVGDVTTRPVDGMGELVAPETAFEADGVPNVTDAVAQADRLTDQIVYRDGSIDYAGDRDVYRFIVPDDDSTPDVLQIDLEDLNSSLVTQIAVLDGTGTVLLQLPPPIALPDPGSNLLAYPSLSLSVGTESDDVIQPGQDFFLQVSGVTTEDSNRFGNSTGQYLLTIEPLTDADLEVQLEIANDRLRLRGDGDIQFDGDVDAFTFTIPDDLDFEIGEFLEIVVEPREVSLLDATFEVQREPSGGEFFKLIESSDAGTTAFLTLQIGNNAGVPGSRDQVAPGDRIRVLVRGQEQTRGEYRIVARDIRRDSDGRMCQRREFANPSVDVMVIVGPETGTPAPNDPTIDFAGDTDSFEFTVPGLVGDTSLLAQVNVQRLGSAGEDLDSSNVLLMVMPAAGSEVAPTTDESDVPESSVFVAGAGATYRVDVGFEGIEVGDYRITVLLSDLGDADESNNSTATAEVIVLEADDDPFFDEPDDDDTETRFSGSNSGALQAPGDNDFYSFTPLTSGLLEIELELESLGTDMIAANDEFTLAITADPATPAFDAEVTSRSRVDDGRLTRVLEVEELIVDANRTYFFNVGSTNSTASYELNLDFFGDDDGGGGIQLDDDDPGTTSTGSVSRVDSVVSRLVSTGENGRLNIVLKTQDGLVAEINVFDADSAGNPDGEAIATKQATRSNEVLTLVVSAFEDSHLLVTVGSAQTSTGQFSLDFLLQDQVDDDVPDRADRTDPDDDIQFEPGEIPGEFESVTLNRRINFDADVDVFAFVSPFTGRVAVTLDAVDTGSRLDSGSRLDTGSQLDPALAVFELTNRPDAESLVDFDNPLQSDDNSGAGLNSALDFRVITGRTYFVEASAANAVAGNYEITFSTISGDDFGNSLNSADALILNANGVLSRDRNDDGDVADVSESNRPAYGVLTSDDTDVFRFQSTVTRQLLISAVGVTGDVVPLVSVLEDTGDLRQLVTSGETEVVLDAVQGRDYFLQLDSLETSSGLYQIRIEPVDVTRRLKLTETTLADGTAVDQGEVTTDPGEMTTGPEIRRAGQADFYQFRAPRAGRVVVELTGMESTDNDNNATVNPIVSVLDSSRVEIAVNDNATDDTNNSRLEFNVNTRETFLVRAALVGKETGRYSLKVTLLPDDADDATISNDPGEIIRDATPLTFTTTSDGRRSAVESVTLERVTQVTFGPATDTDLYSFKAESTGRVSVSLTGAAATDSQVTALLKRDSGGDLVLATGAGGALNFGVVTGETYAVQLTGLGTGELQVVLTPIVNTTALTFLSDSVGNATTERLGQVFTQLTSSGASFTGQELADEVLSEFFKASGRQENLQQRFLLLYVDPVDFVLESSTGQQAGFTADSGQLDQYGNTFYSGDAVTELLVIPQADSGRYSLQLEGLGQDVRGGVSLVSNAGVTSSTFEFQNLTGSLVLPIDFQETELPGQFARTDDIEAPVPSFPVSVILTALLGISEPETATRSVGTSFRDVINYLPLPFWPDGIPELPQILGDLADDLRAVLPVEYPDWDFQLTPDPDDEEPDWLLPAVTPGLAGLTEAMSRFGELFGELLLPIAEADEAESDDSTTESDDVPAEELPADPDANEGAARLQRPRSQRPEFLWPPDAPDTNQADEAEPGGKTERKKLPFASVWPARAVSPKS